MSFTLGVNLPWIRYGGDFGGNAWMRGGGVAGAARETAARALGDIAASGATVVRWFLLCDGRAGLTTDDRGRPLGLDDQVLHDVEAALTLASAHHLQVMFVLVDFSWCRRGRRVNGVDLGGRRRMLADDTARPRLIETVILPIVSTFGRHEAIWAWDVINEPEWATLGLGTLNPTRAISSSAMRAFIGEATEAIHAHATQPVTVGQASTRWCSFVKDLPLDFFQFHWYDKLEGRAPIDRAVTEFGLDRPVVLGEFPTRGSGRTAGELFGIARDRGYAGAFPWSWLAEDDATDRDATRASIERMGAERAIVESGDRPSTHS